MTNRARYLNLVVLVGASIALWWQSLAASLELALSSDAHTHMLLILPLTIALIYFEPKGSLPAFETNRAAGAILLSAALFFRGCAAWNPWHLSSGNCLSLNMFAIVIWWIGSVVLCFGMRVFRFLQLPLWFLFLIVPLPEAALRWTVHFLQYQSAAATSILFRLAHVPVTRDGIILWIPGLEIDVEESCSSIRSSTMLVVITFVLAQLFLRSWWRKILLVVVALPLSIAKNAVRIFTIAELGTHVDRGFLNGRLHRQGGLVFLGLALIPMLVMLWGLRRSEQGNPQGSPPGNKRSQDLTEIAT